MEEIKVGDATRGCHDSALVQLLCQRSGEISESFADDFHSAASSPDIDVISETLNSPASELNDWAVENGMGISAPKSTTTLFTPWTKQVNKQLDVSIDSVLVPTVKNPRMLGVTFDPMLFLVPRRQRSTESS